MSLPTDRRLPFLKLQLDIAWRIRYTLLAFFSFLLLPFDNVARSSFDGNLTTRVYSSNCEESRQLDYRKSKTLLLFVFFFFLECRILMRPNPLSNGWRALKFLRSPYPYRWMLAVQDNWSCCGLLHDHDVRDAGLTIETWEIRSSDLTQQTTTSQ